MMPERNQNQLRQVQVGTAPSKLHTLLLVLILVVLAIGIWVISKNQKAVLLRDESSNFENSASSSEPLYSDVDWQSLLPQIKTILIAEFGSAGTMIPVAINKEMDLTGDSVPEAIVSVDAMGAYTSTAAIVRMEGGSPVVARMKNNDGSITPASFEAGASVMNQLGYEFLPEKNGFYTRYTRMEEGTDGEMHMASCALYAYLWNNTTKLFEYNSPESIRIASEQCSV